METCSEFCNTDSLKCLFEGGGVLLVFDIDMCLNLSHTSVIYIKLTSIRPVIPHNRLMGYIVQFTSFRQTFMGKCNELCNSPLAEMFV